MLIEYLVTTILISVCLCDENPQVKTPLGEVRGYVQTSNDGRKYSAFEGIPFAKPPIGKRRFEEPKPVEPWSGVWNASFLTTCAQTTMMVMENLPKVDEDCLHINVYVPRERPNPDEKLDVVVHIHGGAYMYCSGHFYSNPKYLMDRELIFVTFNYRLGILGFLSTEDDVVPGNNGLKDQALALKWVQENIASFGGNPKSVTLTGISAGGASVHLHYFSELSKGLFHRGMSQSGVALNSFSLQKEPLAKAKLLADGVGCPTDSTRAMVRCLKQRPYHHLMAQMPLFFGYDIMPLAPFGPVVEKGKKSTAFLTENPYRLLKQGKVYDVPWVCSNTAHEGTVSVMFIKETMAEVNREWERIAPYMLDFNYTIPRDRWAEVSRKIKEFYLGENQDLDFGENLLKTVQMFSDRIFLTDAEDAVKLHSKAAKSPVYYYHFSYPGENSEYNMVPHAGDTKYFFGGSFMVPTLTDNELPMKDMLLEMLISYIKTNKPTMKGIHWEPTEGDIITYLNISTTERENNKLQTTEEFTPRSFWKSLEIQENENIFPVKDEL